MIDVFLGHRLLGRHVLRRADGNADGRELFFRRCPNRLRDSEIHHGRVLARQHHVVRLDVAMHHAEVVCVRERVGDFLEQAHRFVDRELAFDRKAGTQRLAINVRHHVIEKAVHLARIVQRENVRVMHLCDDMNLARKAVDSHRGAELRTEDLERDFTIVLDVAREIHHGHSTLADLAFDFIAAAERGRELHIDGQGGNVRETPVGCERSTFDLRASYCTTTDPVISLWIAQWYGYVPAAVNVRVECP